ncbi:MAG: hypothetical protein H6766_07855 [Candidatus Peribacteria bacterium]|nr:MAG: hypothetical protein H6766_07855 [Candidatus Peribacteria bacterium]
MEDLEVQRRQHLFRDYAVEGNEPDAMLMDVVSGNHRAIWYTKPEDLDRVTQLHPMKTKGASFDVQGHTLHITVDKYVHRSLRNEANKLLTIWVGTPDEVREQIRNGFGNTDKRKYVVNVEKYQNAKTPKHQNDHKTNNR